MAEGTVKWFSVSKGYGFIVPDGGGKDVFLHMSVLNAANVTFLEDGTRVSFDLEPDRDKDRISAVHLAVLGAVQASS